LEVRPRSLCRHSMPGPRKLKTAIVVVVIVILMASGLYYLGSRTIILSDHDLGAGYDSESYSYDVKIDPGASGTFGLLLPYPQLIVEEIRPVDGNSTFVQSASEHGQCLNVTCTGHSGLRADNRRQLPLNSDLLYWNLELTMTNNSWPDPGRSKNITAWIWSSSDNISLELTFSAGHSRYRSEMKWAAGEGYYDKLNCTLQAGWQNVSIERHWWVT